MSKKILKQCLEIVEENLIESKSKKQIRKKKPTNSTIFDMIPEQKRLQITTKKGKTQIKQKVNKIKATEKFTLKKAKNIMMQSKDRTEENVKRLLALGGVSSLDEETKNIMVERARCGHYVVPVKEEKPEEEDVFTAEDFAKFEREYFCK